jgi:hypothetical protein
MKQKWHFFTTLDKTIYDDREILVNVPTWTFFCSQWIGICTFFLLEVIHGGSISAFCKGIIHVA